MHTEDRLFSRSPKRQSLVSLASKSGAVQLGCGSKQLPESNLNRKSQRTRRNFDLHLRGLCWLLFNSDGEKGEVVLGHVLIAVRSSLELELELELEREPADSWELLP